MVAVVTVVASKTELGKTHGKLFLDPYTTKRGARLSVMKQFPTSSVLGVVPLTTVRVLPETLGSLRKTIDAGGLRIRLGNG